ncbi:unnamed protein product (macronuclear) [Paramecium tetraurelia]|uniref:Transmembrane protein n=1 Tax=Paramecium tetraurelia TaxID=5888 RepID=A0D8Q6_PARTE|nr:uncharacterized protein GSPATT00014369001 [Paramecium tetraurelia]CAK79423.1 unnamed protein product [Paramecium tetraurelia]|eukprot:XP_001446820.1 hypothetical protein (macronuclear) [Paramecium tetraurelia strain d4-2]
MDDSIDCNKYFSKLDTQESQTIFSGDVDYFQDSKEVQINLKYTDVLFEDQLYFGLVQEDGRHQKQHVLSFIYQYAILTINAIILNQHMIEKQYHQILPNRDNIHSKYQFHNQISLARLIILVILTFQQFLNQLIKYLLNMNSSLIFPLLQIIIQTTTAITAQQIDQYSLRLCSDLKCSKFLKDISNLDSNDLFVLELSHSSKSTFFTNIEVFFIGKGFNKTVTPVQVINSFTNQAIIQLKTEIVWKGMKIQFKNQLIKLHQKLMKDQCATGQQECQINGIAQEECGVYDRQGFLASVHMTSQKLQFQ